MKKNTLTGSTRRLVMTAMLSAVSVVLMYLKIPLPFLAPTFIEFDVSDLPALIASFSMGSVPGIAVCFIKNGIHLFATTTGGVGELSNFLLSAVFVTVAGKIYRHYRTRRAALVGSLLGALAMAVICVPSNYFIVYPFYYNLMPEETILAAYQAIFPFVDNILECLIISNAPFTFLKGMASTAICFMIYKPLSGFIKGTSSVKRPGRAKTEEPTEDAEKPTGSPDHRPE